MTPSKEGVTTPKERTNMKSVEKKYKIKCHKCGKLLREFIVPYYYDDELEEVCFCDNCFSQSQEQARQEGIDQERKIRLAHGNMFTRQDLIDVMGRFEAEKIINQLSQKEK